MSVSTDPDCSTDTPAFLGPLDRGLAIAAAVAIPLAGVVFFEHLPLIILAGLLAVAGFAMIRWPDLTTLIVIGLIYSNLPVVAVNYHGAPDMLPAAVLAMLAWPLAFQLLIRRESFRLLPATPFVAALAVVHLIGAFWIAREPAVAVSHLISFILEGVFVYLLMTNLIRTRRMAVASFWVLALCAILMGAVPFVQQVTGTFETNYGGLAQADSQFASHEVAGQGVVRQQRAAGTIGEQNRYAQFMILLVPICFSLIGIADSRRLKSLAAGSAFAALLGFALAFSRGAAVGLVLAFGIAVWLRLVSTKQIKYALIAAAVVLLLLPQYITRLSSLGALVGIVGSSDSTLDQADGAVRGRLTEMGAALLIFRDHPLLGVGPGMFGEYSQHYGQMIGLRPLGEGRQAHSMPLDIAAEHGLLGLLAMGGLIAAVFRSLLRAHRRAVGLGDSVGQHLTTGMLLVVILYLTTGLFLHLSYIRYFWLIIGLADAIGYLVANEDRPEVSRSLAD